MQYNQLVTDLNTLLVIPSGDPSFAAILPALIDDAEQRIYRELDFLYTRTTYDSTPVNFVNGSRVINAPSTAIVIQGLSAITPVGSQAAAGTRNVLELVSLDFIDSTWPTESVTALPQYFAMKTDTIVVVAPTPDNNYIAEFTGTFRPPPMSATNQETWLGDHLPDLFLAACMVFGSAYLRDYGAGSSDPQLAMSWEAHYQSHKQSAIEEEQRRKTQGTGWSPYSPTPLSTPRT
jgi:hypothetical protein